MSQDFNSELEVRNVHGSDAMDMERSSQSGAMMNNAAAMNVQPEQVFPPYILYIDSGIHQLSNNEPRKLE